jgi:hypothetical protein
MMIKSSFGQRCFFYNVINAHTLKAMGENFAKRDVQYLFASLLQITFFYRDRFFHINISILKNSALDKILTSMLLVGPMNDESPKQMITTKAATINIPRLALGGVAAGIILNIITGIANASILNGDFQNWANGMGNHLHPPAQPVQMCFWVLMCLIDGMAGVWIYAGTRPRLGAGPKTALLAGLLVWTVGRLCVAFDMLALGVFPWRLLAGQSILGLIAILPGVLAGAWIYKE